MSGPEGQRLMTLGEHLEELRAHVLRATVVLVIALAVTITFQEPLMAIVVGPHQRAAERIAASRIEQVAQRSERDRPRLERTARLLAELEQVQTQIADAARQGWNAEQRVTLARRYYTVWGQLQQELPAPLPPHRLVVLRYQDAFLGYFKVALLAAVIVAFPYFLYEIWRFVSEGLKPHERFWVQVFAPASLLLFVAGVAFGWTVLLPITLQYLLGYGSPELFQAGITMDSYLELIFWLDVGVGIMFELPLAIVFAWIVGMVDSARLAGWRRYFVLVAFIIAAVITPTGDPVTLTIAALPMLALYEIGYVAVRLLEARRARHSEDRS